MFQYAIARLPGVNFDLGLTTTELGSPSYSLILTQHRAYIQTLTELGLQVTLLEEELNYPDAYFVEDTAIITPSVAIITHPGAPSRRGEEEKIEPLLHQYRPIERIVAPGTVDGGDVMMADNHFFIGTSLRTNLQGAAQLAEILSQYGHSSELVPVHAGLHLKSSVSYLGEDMLLLTKVMSGYPCFAGYSHIVLHPDEEYAANTLRINDVLLTPKGFPRTFEQLTQLGLRVIEMDVSEVQKMDGGLSCMSLRF